MYIWGVCACICNFCGVFCYMAYSFLLSAKCWRSSLLFCVHLTNLNAERRLVYIPYFPVYSPSDGHSKRLQLPTIANHTIVNILLHDPFGICVRISSEGSWGYWIWLHTATFIYGVAAKVPATTRNARGSRCPHVPTTVLDMIQLFKILLICEI